MNDRFKFRVWFEPDWQKPEMIYEAEHTYDNRCRNKGSFHHESFGEILEDKDCIVMQCTGLKDKNGKLIYEGDIVTDDIDKYIIEWEGEPNYQYFAVWLPIEICKTCSTLEQLLSIEVIGNIYENKELLNENS